MDALSFWQIVQWIFLAIVLIAFLMYIYFGMDSLRRWYFIHDVSKYVTFALFIYFFSPLLFMLAGATVTTATTSTASTSSSSSWSYRTANVSDAMHWIHGASVSSVPGCQVPILLFTDLIVATVSGVFVFYTLLDPMLHGMIHKQATENRNAKLVEHT
jgi:uncharacterized membrane protein YfcA